jgi:aromatic ring-opening dioxygenase catalytic subunit (LigB family)
MTVLDTLDPASWRAQLDSLPSNGRIPAFFFAHGCISHFRLFNYLAPLLIWPPHLPARLPLDSIGGSRGPNAQFLRDFGKIIMEKYNPKAIVVFSAHWETHGHIEGIRFVRFH